MAILFTLTFFTSAALLFVVQPLAGKSLLPWVGGTPAVWNTCLVFFQSCLLLGYLYAHALARRPLKMQVIIHGILAVGSLAIVLITRPNPEWIPADQEYPLFGLLLFLSAFVGLPYTILSATAPLLQSWFSHSNHSRAADPYFLYAASNAGSFFGLLGYPFLVEPQFELPLQYNGWLLGVGGLFLLIAGCAFLVSRNPGATAQVEAATTSIPKSRLALWLLLAAVPSSLLMSCTYHLSTDVAPVPLLWVIPLALYLLSFVIVFARWGRLARKLIGRVMAMLLIFLVVVLLIGATEPLWLAGGIHLLLFFAAALLCHGELAHDRPDRQHLTLFFLTMSCGGVIGGLFNSLLAPWIFSSFGLIEYPLILAFLAFIRPNPDGRLESLSLSKRDLLLVGGIALLTLSLILGLPKLLNLSVDPQAPDAEIARMMRGGLLFGLPAALIFGLAARVARFGLALTLLLLLGSLDPGPYGRPLLTSRNFFGTLRVTLSPDGKLIRLVHGTTLHGQEFLNQYPAEPLMYYHRKGPVGQLFNKLPAEHRRNVALIGLGCGAMAAYARPGEKWTYYEIDPAVERIARDTRYFHFLAECQGNLQVVLGDARRKLLAVEDHSLDLIVLDAFSSDAIPVHLLTREAFALYRQKLAPGGLLLFHLSNRYLDLPPLVNALALDASPALEVRVNDDSNGDTESGRMASTWVLIAPDAAALKASGIDLRWQPISQKSATVWTDHFSNLLSVWKRSPE